MNKPSRVALFFSSFRTGGVERIQINLAEEFQRRGIDVDLVVVNNEGAFRAQVPKGINIIDLGVSRTLFSIAPLVRYLRTSRPDALLSSQTHNNSVAIIAKKLAGCKCRIIVSEHTDLRMVVKDKSIKEKLRPTAARFFYPLANKIVAVSKGTAEALSATSGLPIKIIQVIYNPVVTPELIKSAQDDVKHPWLKQNRFPVILSVGRLDAVKDYSTLLNAFSIILKRKKSFLLILGEGKERERLESLAITLGIDQYTDLVGYKPNPYAYLSKASVFVLSSVREGLSNVIIEALACGIPVVSTDCPSGPAEVLENGRYGKLTPVGNPDALADAVLETLDNPLKSSILKKRAADFTVEKIANQYIDILLQK